MCGVVLHHGISVLESSASCLQPWGTVTSLVFVCIERHVVVDDPRGQLFKFLIGHAPGDVGPGIKLLLSCCLPYVASSSLHVHAAHNH